MIERLDQITMSKFIDLVNGDLGVLGIDDNSNAKEIRKKLIIEYRNIVDEAGMKSILIDGETKTKLKARVIFFHICDKLINLEALDNVRALIKEYGMSANVTDIQLKKVVSSELHKAIFEYKRNTETSKKPDKQDTDTDIHSRYAGEIASIMAYFKMQIDINTISAAIYANLVAQANREMKVKMAALKK